MDNLALIATLLARLSVLASKIARKDDPTDVELELLHQEAARVEDEALDTP